MNDEIQQIVKSGEKSICPGCIHEAVCKRAVNQPCIWCKSYLAKEDVEMRRKWHSVKKELPEKPGTYLISTNRNKVITAFYASEYKRFNGQCGKTCTHWMEVPDGPLEAENG